MYSYFAVIQSFAVVTLPVGRAQSIAIIVSVCLSLRLCRSTCVKLHVQTLLNFLQSY